MVVDGGGGIGAGRDGLEGPIWKSALRSRRVRCLFPRVGLRSTGRSAEEADIGEYGACVACDGHGALTVGEGPGVRGGGERAGLPRLEHGIGVVESERSRRMQWRGEEALLRIQRRYEVQLRNEIGRN